MCLHPLFQCNCISNTVKAASLNIVHVSQCHLQLLKQSEFCFPLSVFVSCVSQPSCVFFFFQKGKLFNSCVEQDQRNSKWKNSHFLKTARRIREARQCGNDM